MVYDITEPDKAIFVNYINSRDFSSDIAGDDSPEGLHFISGEDSLTGQAQLVAAYEVSGTVGVYDVTLEKNTSSDNNDDNKPEDTPSDNNDNKLEDTPSTDNKPSQNDNPQTSSESKDNNSNKDKEENKGLIVNTKDFADTMTLVTGVLGSAVILITLAKKKKES